MIRNGCWSPKPRSREDFCSKDQRIHWLEIETRSASPLHSPCLHYSYLFGTHTHSESFSIIKTRFTRHSVWWLFHFTFFLIRIIHHSRTNKKRLKVRFASRSTLYHPNETLVPTQNRSVCAFDGSKFFSPFFCKCLVLEWYIATAPSSKFESLLNF